MVEEVIPRIRATGHNGAANLMQTGPFDESSNGLLPDHQMDEHGMQVQRNHDSYLQQQYNGESNTVINKMGWKLVSRLYSLSHHAKGIGP